MQRHTQPVPKANARRRFALSPRLVAKERRKQTAATVGMYTFLVITGLPLVIGYGWLIVNSFSTSLAHGVWPEAFTLGNWRFLFEPPSRFYPSLWRTTWNTLWLALGMTVTIVAISTPTAYALSRSISRAQHVLVSTLVLHDVPRDHVVDRYVLCAASPQPAQQHSGSFSRQSRTHVAASNLGDERLL